METLFETSQRKLRENETPMRMHKGRDGWTAKTVIKNLLGYDWNISTMKRSSGQLITIATGGKYKDEPGYSTFSFSMFTDPNISLGTSNDRGTDKNVEALHNQSLVIFDQKIENGEIKGKTNPEYEVTIGQIVLSIGGQGFEDHKLAIYEIDSERDYYHMINLKTLAITGTDRLRNYKDKFGIGHYFIEDSHIELEELNNLVGQAKSLKAEKDQERELLKLQQQEDRAVKLEKGQWLLSNLPEELPYMIVALFKEDKSDIQTDYFAHTVSKTIYLAFSNNDRDSFKEMRTAALNSELTKHMAEAPESWEHREKYSMGRGYYLSKDRHEGIEIRKYSPKSYTREDLYIAAAENRFFCEMPDQQATPPIIEEPVNNVIETLPTTNATELSLYEQHTMIHTVKKHTLYVIKLVSQVSKHDFQEYRNIAKRFNGYYSSFNKDGAIPGFHFLTDEDRQQAQLQFNKIRP